MTDTHGRHGNFEVPLCDVLVHCGDFSKRPTLEAIEDLNNYFDSVLTKQKVIHQQWQEQRRQENDEDNQKIQQQQQQQQEERKSTKVPQIICIAGNHDMLFHSRGNNQEIDNEAKRKLTNSVYLEDATYNYNALEIYGSPWQPHHSTPFNAFKLPRDLLYRKWDKIPTTTDILLTHSPPLGRGDLSSRGIRAGCLSLLNSVQTRIRPRLHLSGHLHEASGASYDGHTLFINSCQHKNMEPKIKTCLLVDVPHDQSLPAMIVNNVLEE